MQFNWQPQPQAAALVRSLLDACVDDCPPLADLRDRMRDQAGTRLISWVDFIQAPIPDPLQRDLADAGFTPAAPHAGMPAWEHPGAIFPTIIKGPGPDRRVGIKVDSVADFAAVHRIDPDQPILGIPWGPVRLLDAFQHGGVTVTAVERHGARGLDTDADTSRTALALRHLEQFRRRPRDIHADEPDAFDRLLRLIDLAVRDLGTDAACDLFFYAEREFWQRRNHAAQVQKARQDSLGLGWANHDHHTYRNSRAHFHRTIAVLQRLGFHKRERFYAGAEAGWGAQVLEQPTCRITVFADVDLSPDEIAGDFSSSPLPPRDTLGTVGLWCALHGESMLAAGMHHLECEFDFDALRDQLASLGIGMMDPFTNMPVLRQAFTEGQRWSVDPDRVADLLRRGLITPQQADAFLQNGAIGSHLENLQRDDGYKGFNQKGVSDIIARTDPRARVGA